MPAEEKTWMDKCRLIEVYMRHGFFQVSLDGYDGVMGIPGMFAVYRRSRLLEVGGMVQGMNGEDTDICMRLTAAGYRSVADPNAVYYSETPASYAHLLEQRTRWFRSIYHLTARNRAMLFDRQTMSYLRSPLQPRQCRPPRHAGPVASLLRGGRSGLPLHVHLDAMATRRRNPARYVDDHDRRRLSHLAAGVGEVHPDVFGLPCAAQLFHARFDAQSDLSAHASPDPTQPEATPPTRAGSIQYSAEGTTVSRQCFTWLNSHSGRRAIPPLEPRCPDNRRKYPTSSESGDARAQTSATGSSP